MSHHLRQTGRTTQMLEKALVAAREGREVWIVGRYHVDTNHLEHAFAQLAQEKLSNTRFIPFQKLNEFSRGRPLKNVVLFVDHYVYEEEGGYVARTKMMELQDRIENAQ